MSKKIGIQQKVKVFRVLILCAFTFIMGIILVLFSFKMEDTVNATGQVGAIHHYELTSKVEGPIKTIHAKEGKSVKTGDTIIEFDSTSLQDQIKMLESDIGELKAEIKVKRNDLSILEKDPLPKEYRHARIALEAARKKLANSQSQLDRVKRLYQRQITPKAKVEQQEITHAQHLADYKRAEEIFEKVSSGLGTDYINKAKSEIQLLETKLKSETSRLEILKSHLADFRIIAPADGKVVELKYKEGYYLKKGQVVLKMATINRKKLYAYVDERAIYRIKVGQKARITSSVYNHYHFGYFTGEIRRIKDLPVQKGNTAYYPVEILISQEHHDLKLGSTAELSIITGRDRIFKILLGMNTGDL